MSDSSFGRIAGALTAPTRTFRAIAERPTWAVVLVVLIAVALLASLLLAPRIDFEEMTRQALERQGRQVSESQVETALAFQERFGLVLAAVNPLVFGVLFYLVAALVFWLGFRLAGSDIDYRTSLSTTLHGFLPAAVAGLLNVPVILSRQRVGFEEMQTGGNLLRSNLGFLAPEDASMAVRALLSSLDLFSVWIVVLLILGFTVTARVSRRAATGVVASVWIFGVLVKTGWVALFS